MTLVNTHRRCAVCKNSTTDMNQDKCKCGGYMHPVGFVYQPKVVKSSETTKAQAS